MKLLSIAFALSVAFASSGPAAAHVPRPRPIAVDVRLDCEGAPCSEVWSGGRRYVVGEAGQRYSIVVTNPTDRWVEAVVVVDGRDVLEGERPGSRTRGYLVPPRDRIAVEGWRLSRRDVAAFRFSSVGDSYAARMGDASDAGQVRVAIYPERFEPPPVWIPEPELNGIDDGDGGAMRKSGRAPAPAATSEAEGRARQHGEWYADDGRNLGTELGESRWQPVAERHFERASDRPAQVVTIGYDDRAGLVARGILPTPWYGFDDDGEHWVRPPSR
ncbi:MAG: hypothetical protein U1F43_34200 [Myxococcota bacterium]